MGSNLPPDLQEAVWLSRCALRLIRALPSMKSLEARSTAEKLANAVRANFSEPWSSVNPEAIADIYVSDHLKRAPPIAD